jgi:hypothetical protein
MKVSWPTKIMCGIALLIICACGGSGGSGNSDGSVYRSVALHLDNTAGAPAVFTYPSSNSGGTSTATVGAGKTTDVTGYAKFPKGAINGTLAVSVQGFGGETASSSVTMTKSEPVNVVVATWDDVNLTMHKS